MKLTRAFHVLSSSLTLVACLALMAPEASAQSDISKSDFGGNGRVIKRRPSNRPAFGGDEGTKPTGAPEIEPSLAAGGFLLLIGGSLILLGRRRRATV